MHHVSCIMHPVISCILDHEMSFNVILKRYIKEARAEETRRIKVEGASVGIGTGAGNEIQLEGLGISIKHAVIEKADDNTYRLTDLGAGSTYVNNDPISEKRRITGGDEIKIGPYALTVTIPEAEEPATILVTQVAGVEEDEPSPGKREEKVKYVSRYKLSTSLFKKTTLSILGVTLLCVFTAFWIEGEDKKAFSPGKLSDAHAQFNDDCGACHTVGWNTVPDKACLDCHETSPHNENELFTPSCIECHSEHIGEPVLADIDDKFCTQCHSDLMLKSYAPSSKYETEILGFNSGHPEFAVVVRMSGQDGSVARVRLNDEDNLTDNTPLELNHKVHLQPNLRGPDGPENLSCESCHRVDPKGEYTSPINYERNCARCHTLEFDPRFGGKVVPHETTDLVDDFLQKTYTEYAVNNADRLGLGGGAGAIKQWVSSRVEDAEDALFRKKKCAECHTIEESGGRLPEVAEPRIPVRWLPHGMFDHELHVKNLGLKCDSCHDAENSEQTTDVLMPSINECQSCHSPGGGAKTECVLCHEYHQREEKAGIEGTKNY